MKRTVPGWIRVATTLLFALKCNVAAAGPLDNAECIAPANPGGGFELSCKLIQTALVNAKSVKDLRVTFMPGGIGAVAFKTIAEVRRTEASTLVAFSGGTLLNLAQEKFGRHNEKDVRWLAAVGADYGVVVVADSSPFRTLKDLLAAIKADPAKLVFGGGGTVGSQDWLKAAMIARAAGISYKGMRYVAFEGGGDAIRAMVGGHIHAYTGDASEAISSLAAGARLRVLAVFADRRLTGPLASVPTAKELGYDIEWPIIRGFYMGPMVRDTDFTAWKDAFTKLLASKQFDQMRSVYGLYPLSLVGAELENYVAQKIQFYRRTVDEFDPPRR
jgi:putative tricarboxylic transport membrane protein